MKKIWMLCIVLILTFANVSSVSAYGGGGGTPPVYDNPHAPVILECKVGKHKLPFGQELSYPKCKIVKNPAYKQYEKDFQQRLKDFLKRVRKGGQ